MTTGSGIGPPPSSSNQAAAVVFILVHGAWQGASAWTDLIPRLEERGHAAIALDLPGAGRTATTPRCFLTRPVDPEAVATEPSPSAGVTQEDRTEAVVAVIRASGCPSGGGDEGGRAPRRSRVVLVGHSLGGLTVSAVAERIPDEIAAVVYVSAFLLPGGTTSSDIGGWEEMSESLVRRLVVADPAKVGALRIDATSTDPAYLSRLRSTFYDDITDDHFVKLMGEHRLQHDEPTSVSQVPSPVTPERFGTVARHFVRLGLDRALPPAAQDRIVRIVDEALGGSTTVHRMETSHSPFYSDPGGLADTLSRIATLADEPDEAYASD